ncbi:MAG: Gfo/Idh/MocA family oxidoreductase [Solirubrobacterales bacterium]|nr:Gfo/Idh/MocA family oxidoreductase [Solirubrobacterales bacterium]MCB0860595.1 Gfo/Idh/MocA family oxidoreductase [Solirubrobacterales bacterium]HRV59711.1 Gfo/Idh/MocA family oxidoreductase [Solirubrobacterales bacterium]
MKVALCGLGEIGQIHLKAIRESGHELVAVLELNRRLAVESVGDDVPIHTEVVEMVELTEPDVVDICLPHHLHVPIAVAALEAGADVLLEKPMAMDLEGCDEIIEAADRHGRKVGISHNQVHFRPHRRLRELIDSSQLGEIRAIYERLWMGGKYGGWREDSSQVGGGLLMDAGVHRVYMAEYLGGPVKAVTAVMDEPRSEDAFVLTLEFESGAIGVIQGGYHGPDGVFDDRIDIQGSAGMAEVLGCEAFFEGDLTGDLRLRAQLGGEWSDDPVTGDWDESVTDSVKACLDDLSQGNEPEVGMAEGRDAVAVVEAAYRSAETGKTISISDLDERAS